MNELRAIVVDDEPSSIFAMRLALDFGGYSVDSFEDIATAERGLEDIGSCDLVMTDKGARYAPGRIGHRGGLAFSGDAKRRFPYALVIVVSGEEYDDRDVSPELVKSGADIFIERSGFPEALFAVMELQQKGRFQLPPRGVFEYWGLREDRIFENGIEVRREPKELFIKRINSWPIRTFGETE